MLHTLTFDKWRESRTYLRRPTWPADFIRAETISIQQKRAACPPHGRAKNTSNDITEAEFFTICAHMSEANEFG